MRRAGALALGLGILILIALARAGGADASHFEDLRSRFPQGIPWHIEIFDDAGKNLGDLDMVLTSRPAESCQKDFGRGYRVTYSKHPEALGSWKLGSYGIAIVTGNTLELDLTGGRCDDFVMTKGEMAADGTSTGEVFTLHKVFGNDLGTYHATLR